MDEIIKFKSHKNEQMESSKHRNDCYNHGEEQQESQCPQCGNRYSESSSSPQQSQSSGSNQRILIPIKRDLLQKNVNQPDIELLLQNFQKQIETLKSENISKDRMIENMKRQMEQKMAHYALYGEINRQNEEISRLRSEIQFANMNQNTRGNLISEGDLPLSNRMKRNSSVDVEYGFNFNTKPNLKQAFRDNDSSSSFGNDYNFTSAYDIGNKNHQRTERLLQSLQKNKINPSKLSLHARINTQRSKFLQKEPNIQQHKSIFKISEAKKKIQELQKLVSFYQEQFIWLKNFVNSFIKTMEKIGSKKHSERIFLEKWGLKKKVKACWRYLKHLLQYLYQE